MLLVLVRVLKSAFGLDKYRGDECMLIPLEGVTKQFLLLRVLFY